MGNAAGVPGGYYADTDGQPFKYNEKELDRMHGMTLYDYNARTMDPTFKYCGISLYAYCANNFVNAIDPDGRDWYRHNETGNYYWREGHGDLDGYTNVGSSVSIQVGEDSYLNYYQNGGIWANQAVDAFDLIRSSPKLQKQFLEKKSALSAQSQTELLNSLNSRDLDEIARPIGEALVKFGAAEMGGVLAGKLIGYALKAVAKGGAKSFFEGAKYSDKVLRQMDKADDILHGFPKSVDGYAIKFGQWSIKVGVDGKVYRWLKMPGGYGGKTGTFEYIKDANGVINHRFFNIH